MIAPSFIRPKSFIAAAFLFCLAPGMQAQQSRVTGPVPMNWEAAGDCLGDVNLDGTRDLLDAVRLIRHITKAELLIGDGLANADVDKNGTVDLQDAARLRRHIVGLDPLPGCPSSSTPRITSITPQRGPAGTRVTINGVNFDPNPAGNGITFSDQPVPAISATNTQLVLAVPDQRAGLAQIKVTANGRTSAPGSFVVDRFQPRVSFKPLSLLGGSAPPFVMTLQMDSGDLPIANLRMGFTNAAFKIADLALDRPLGNGYLAANYFLTDITLCNLFLIKEIVGSTVQVQVETRSSGLTLGIVSGRIEPNGSGFAIDLDFVPPAGSGINDMGGLTAGSNFLLLLNPGLIQLPSGDSSRVDISTSFRSVAPLAGNALSGTAPSALSTASPLAGAPLLQQIAPFDPVFRQEVQLRGSGFGGTPGDNRVSFAGPNNTRIPADVVNAAPTALDVLVPAGVVSGPVLVERGGQASNAHEVWIAYGPALRVSLANAKALTSTGITLDLSESALQLETQSFQTVFSKGGWDFSALVKDSLVGRIGGRIGALYRYDDLYVEDTDGQTSAVIAAKKDPGFDQSYKIYLISDPTLGTALQFMILDDQLAGKPLVNAANGTGYLRLTSALFKAPAAGDMTITTWFSSLPQSAGFKRPRAAALFQTLTIP